MNALILSTTDEYEEFRILASTLGASIEKVFVQRRNNPDPRTYFGSGKLESVAEFVAEGNVDLALVNDYIKPLQHYNLEKTLKVECVDRVGLILKIFDVRATTREAKLQLESARLTYEIPLLREWIHRSKSSEHPGFMAGGEYRIDMYYDKIKKRLLKISKEIEQIRADRQVKREFRNKMGFKTAVLFGYTNAGKSTLFNHMTKSSVFVDEKLFSTLSDTSRRITSKLKRTVILTDTIGFVEAMPHWLIESFRPTVEEILSADCIFWVFDGSDDIEDIERKYKVCKESADLNGGKNVIPVITKSDLMMKKDIESKTETIENMMGEKPCMVSGKNGTGVQELVLRMREILSHPIEIRLVMKNNESTQNALSKLYDTAEVSSVDYSAKDGSVIIHAFCELRDLNRFKVMYRRSIKKATIINQ